MKEPVPAAGAGRVQVGALAAKNDGAAPPVGVAVDAGDLTAASRQLPWQPSPEAPQVVHWSVTSSRHGMLHELLQVQTSAQV